LRYLSTTIQRSIPFHISNFKFINRKPPRYSRVRSKREPRNRPITWLTFGVKNWDLRRV